MRHIFGRRLTYWVMSRKLSVVTLVIICKLNTHIICAIIDNFLRFFYSLFFYIDVSTLLGVQR
jgi:hypothetical protein